MECSSRGKGRIIALALTVSLVLLLTPMPGTDAADHGDAPVASLDRGAEITDVYAFLDPNDNTKLVLELGIHGFIPPGENNNFSPFDPNVNYQFLIDTQGAGIPNQFVNITFSPRTAVTQPQTATIVLPFGETFTAPTTIPSATAITPPTAVVTTDPRTGAAFFAGLRDDPFFFDIPAELLYRTSRTSSPANGSGIDPSVFSRRRDTFAGYNILAIIISIPTSYFRVQPTAGNPGADEIGISSATQRREVTNITQDGVVTYGRFINVDRMGVPGVNTVFIPFARKDEYNRASPPDDVAFVFRDVIVKSLQDLKTGPGGIGILANLVVVRGDMLRLKFSVPNSGQGGGTNPEGGFPNGRRPQDDVIDTIVTIINNCQAIAITASPGADCQQGLVVGVVDGAGPNDVPFLDTFPFFAPPQQPRQSGTIDDNTRN